MKGKYVRKLDQKGRMIIPTEWKIKDEVVVMYQNGYLVVMEEDVWQDMYGIKNYEILDEAERKKERELYSRCYQRKIDKGRRLRIGLLEDIKNNTVEVIGMGNLFEIHFPTR